MEHCVITAPDRNRDGIIAIVEVSRALLEQHAPMLAQQSGVEVSAATGSKDAVELVPVALKNAVLSRIQV